jgi:small-conductance mechanosensitive channel
MPAGVAFLMPAALLMLVWLAVAPAPPARADGSPPLPSEVERETEYQRAVVTLDGESLFAVRGVIAYPVEKRAQIIAGRIEAIAADRSIPVDALRIVQTPHGSDILAGDRFIMTLTETDTKSDGVAHNFMAQLVRLLFAGIASGNITFPNFDREWAWPTYRIIRFVTLAFAVVVAYPYIPGSTSPAFQGVSIFIGVIFSLGSSSFIANLIAGYSMTYRRAFRVGDRIQVGDVTGDVGEIGLMVTRVQTVKNEEIVVPNSTILNSHIVNYSAFAQKGGLILHTTVAIGYETPWRQVEAMLLLAAGRTPGLLTDPPPFVLQKALGDFWVTYEINAYADVSHAIARLYADLHRNILDVFNEYHVQIMTPAYERDPDQPKVVPEGQWFATPALPPEAATPGGA